ncbi:telomeric repeat-binding factor 1 isoform X7 [Cebus imitator]|uniref:telomeric repeat-binding factor 1 isoform X6 n=1 Tax=Cebus imitator TaxID=2715852 RepID=UPI000809EDFB|nr:telomeric repeat-binding factor 1 isoform X6 [Cebus imitator]XP_037600101.1 telomeric repeat-binding factor 1 isoform X7 [Cebus imitator]
MAEDASSAAPSPRGCADGRDADATEERIAETERNDEEQFECQELLECQVQLGAPEEEEDAGLVAEAEAVAAGWMLDFLCLSLCRAFRDGRSEDFRQTRDSAEAIIHGLSSLTAYQLRTVYICQFLTRIAAGKNLDAQFENDERITPLESALMIWGSIEKEHDKLHEEIQNLMEVQPLKRKLLMIISQKDTYHSVFQHFSYNHMMEKIKSYVNYVLSEKSSTFLMKAAAKVVESKRARTITSQDKPNGNDVEMETEANLDTRKSVSDKQSAVTESSEGTVSLLRSHKNLFLSKLKHGTQQQDLSKERRVGTLQSWLNPQCGTCKYRRPTVGAKKKKESRRATESRIPVSESQLVTPEKHRARKRQVFVLYYTWITLRQTLKL